MRRFLLLVVALSSVVMTAPSWAAGEKVAVVDLTRAIFATEVAKAKVKELSAASEYAALQAKFESINADIRQLQKDAETKQATWSQEKKAEYQKKLEYLLADRELTGRKLQAETQAVQQAIVKELRPKAGEALQQLIEEEKIDLLLNAEAVLMASPALDITAKLTDKLNKK
ncbi:MAG: OmpH family outer membrane protein [bacterium]